MGGPKHACRGTARLTELVEAADSDPPGLQWRDLGDLDARVAEEVRKEKGCAWPEHNAHSVSARRTCYKAHADDAGVLGGVAVAKYVVCRAKGAEPEVSERCYA